MGRYDDEKDKGIFPTRVGNSVGTSKERSMLDNLGGSGSLRTQQWIQPDGSTTRLKTKDEMPEFITEGGKEEGARYIDKFFATPSSATYQLGYAPPGVIPPKGPFSEWVKWMGKIKAPLPAGSTRTGDVLTPVRVLDSTVPGSTTWYSNKIRVNGYPVILSWNGYNSRAGTYGLLAQASIADWSVKPSDISGFQLDADCGAGFSPYVWVSDKIRISVGVTVWSAALRKEAGRIYLYVVSGTSVYRAKIALFVMRGDDFVLNSNLSKKPLSMTLVGNFGMGSLSQIPFFNQSGTKIVLFRSAKQISASPVPSPGWSIAEVDVDTLAVTAVFTNMCTQDTPAVTVYLTGSFPSNYAEGFTQSSYNSMDYKIAVAADYRDDVLVYVTIRFTRTLNAYTVTYTATNNGAGVATFTESTSGPETSDVVTVEHSVDGKIFEVRSLTASVVTRTYSGIQDVPNSVYNVTSGISANGGLATRCDTMPFLIAADLRHDFTMFAYRLETLTLTGTGTWSHPGNVYVMSPQEDRTYDSVYRCFVRDAELFRVVHQYAPASSTGMSASLGAAAPFTGISLPAPVSATQTRYDNGPYSFILDDTIGGVTQNVCAKVAHITVSPNGKAAYVGLCWPTTDTETGVDEMYFTFIDSHGNRGTQRIPAATYAPGAASYLSGGIFYPRILEIP